MHTFFFFAPMHHIPRMLVRGQVWCQALWPLMTPFQIRVIYWKYLLCIVCNLIIRVHQTCWLSHGKGALGKVTSFVPP